MTAEEDNHLDLQNIATLVCFIKFIIIEYMNESYNINPDSDEVIDYVIDKLHSILYE